MVASFSPLDVDLALWTLLGIPLSMFNLTGPVTQQLVSFLVLLAVNTFMPRRMALKTPDKLANGALDFVFALRSGRGGDMSFFLEGCKVLALRTWFGARINTAKFQEVLIFDGVFMC